MSVIHRIKNFVHTIKNGVWSTAPDYICNSWEIVNGHQTKNNLVFSIAVKSGSRSLIIIGKVIMRSYEFSKGYLPLIITLKEL